MPGSEVSRTQLVVESRYTFPLIVPQFVPRSGMLSVKTVSQPGAAHEFTIVTVYIPESRDDKMIEGVMLLNWPGEGPARVALYEKGLEFVKVNFAEPFGCPLHAPFISEIKLKERGGNWGVPETRPGHPNESVTYPVKGSLEHTPNTAGT